MQLFDTHCHLNFEAFNNDADEIARKTLDAGISFVNIGVDIESSEKAVEQAKKWGDGVYATVGLHPLHIEGEFDVDVYRKLATSKKVVAIGEIGLDYMRISQQKAERKEAKERQKDVFKQQLQLAQELHLPVIFHCRMANKGIANIFIEHPDLVPQRAVAHGFAGTQAELQAYLGLGFYIGFNGIIFRAIEGIDFEDIIHTVPDNRFLLETDSPYLTPPTADTKRNEPTYVEHVADEVARIRGVSVGDIAAQSTENARTFFNI